MLLIDVLDCGDWASAEASCSEWSGCEYSIIWSHWCTQSDCAVAVNTSWCRQCSQVIPVTKYHLSGWNSSVFTWRWSVRAAEQ